MINKSDVFEIDMNINDILELKIGKVFEDELYYFIDTYNDDPYDSTLYMIDKHTNDVKFTSVITFMCEVFDTVKEIDVQSFKEMLKEKLKKG